MHPIETMLETMETTDWEREYVYTVALDYMDGRIGIRQVQQVLNWLADAHNA